MTAGTRLRPAPAGPETAEERSARLALRCADYAEMLAKADRRIVTLTDLADAVADLYVDDSTLFLGTTGLAVDALAEVHAYAVATGRLSPVAADVDPVLAGK